MIHKLLKHMKIGWCNELGREPGLAHFWFKRRLWSHVPKSILRGSWWACIRLSTHCVLCSLCFLSSWHDIKKLTLTVTGPQLAWFIWKSSRLWSGLLNKSYPIYRAAQWWCRQKERGNFVLIFYRNLKREKIGFGLYSEKPRSQKQMLSVCTLKLSSIFFLYRGIVFSALIFSATSFRSSHYILRTYILFWDKDMNG